MGLGEGQGKEGEFPAVTYGDGAEPGAQVSQPMLGRCLTNHLITDL